MLTFEISNRASGKRSNDIPDSVDSVHDTSSGGTRLGIKVEIGSVLGVAVDRAHEGSIVTIDARIEGCNKQAPVQLIKIQSHVLRRGSLRTDHEHSPGPWRRLLLRVGIG